MIKNPDDAYVGPKGMTKREFIMLEFCKMYIQQHGLNAGLKHAKEATERLINYADELKKEKEKQPLDNDWEDDDESI